MACQDTKNIKDAVVAFMATPAGDAFFKALFPGDNEPRNNHRRAVKYIDYVEGLGMVNNKWLDFFLMIGLSKKDYEKIKNNSTHYVRRAKGLINEEADLMEAEVSVSDDDDDSDVTSDSDKTVPYLPEEEGGQVGKVVIDLTSPDGTKKGEWKNGKFQTQEVEDNESLSKSDSDEDGDDKDVNSIDVQGENAPSKTWKGDNFGKSGVEVATQTEAVEAVEVKTTVEKEEDNFDVTEDIVEVKPTVPTTVDEEETTVDDADEKTKLDAISTTDVVDVKPTVETLPKDVGEILKPTVPTTVDEEKTKAEDADEKTKPEAIFTTDVEDVKPTVETLPKDVGEVLKPTVPTTVDEEETKAEDADEKAKKAIFTTDVVDVKLTVQITLKKEVTVVDDADEVADEATLTTDVVDALKPTVSTTVKTELVDNAKVQASVQVEKEEIAVDLAVSLQKRNA